MSIGRTVLLALSAFSLTSAPVLAQAANSSPSLAARTGASLDDSETVAGYGILVPMIALIAIVLIAVAVSDGDDDRPTSP